MTLEGASALLCCELSIASDTTKSRLSVTQSAIHSPAWHLNVHCFDYADRKLVWRRLLASLRFDESVEDDVQINAMLNANAKQFFNAN
jgi:hypothetical protein